MSDIPQDLLYTEDHEYLKPAGDAGVVFIGITDYAQGELGDVVFVELPKVGAKFKKHDVFGTIEAVKAVSELYAPVSGEVLEINGRLDAEPALVNTEPYGNGWMIKLRMSDEGEKGGLLDAGALPVLTVHVVEHGQIAFLADLLNGDVVVVGERRVVAGSGIRRIGDGEVHRDGVTTPRQHREGDARGQPVQERA